MPFPVAYCHRSDHYIMMIAKLAIASHASVWSDAVLLRARGCGVAGSTGQGEVSETPRIGVPDTTARQQRKGHEV